MKKKPLPHAVQLAACLTALAALGSAILGNVDPVSCLIRGGLAYIGTRFLAGIWFAVLSPSVVEETVEPVPELMAVDVAEGQDQAAA